MFMKNDYNNALMHAYIYIYIYINSESRTHGLIVESDGAP